jgi:hypothetical protein
MCETWPRCTPRSWSRAGDPAATWPAAPTCATPNLIARLGAVTSRRLRAVTVPAGPLLPAARAVGLIQRIVPVHIPMEFEAVYFVRCAARSDDTQTRQELGVAPAISR